MTPKREKFAVELAKGKTQADAYRVAYPTSKKWPATAVHSKASTLAKVEGIRQRVRELTTPALVRYDVTVERVLAERARMAFISVGDLVDENGQPRPLHTVGEDIARGLAGVKWGKDGIEYKLAKDTSLAALEKHLGMYAADDAGKKAGVLNIQINLVG